MRVADEKTDLTSGREMVWSDQEKPEELSLYNIYEVSIGRLRYSRFYPREKYLSETPYRIYALQYTVYIDIIYIYIYKEREKERLY